jgi:hypothetical protein
MFSFTPQLLYFQRNNLVLGFDTSLLIVWKSGWAEDQSGRCGEKKILTCQELNHGRLDRSLVSDAQNNYFNCWVHLGALGTELNQYVCCTQN